MPASYEVLGPGGHEKFAEDIFTKIKNRELTIAEVTKEAYDALTPEQKADPTKLYLVPGSGSYLKFKEISAADYDALTPEEKNDPSTVYLTPGDGTYFRVIDLTQEEYDALSEDEKANPNNLYLVTDGEVTKHIVVRLTWDSTNSCYVADRRLTGSPSLYPEAVLNLIIDEGYTAEFIYENKYETTPGSGEFNAETKHLYLFATDRPYGSEELYSKMYFYQVNKTVSGIEFEEWMAQGAYDPGRAIDEDNLRIFLPPA